MRAHLPAEGARPAESRPPRRPEHALLGLQRAAGNRAVAGWVAQRSYGDPALEQAAAGELPAALGWLGGQSMTALIAIMKRARPRGLLPALLTGLTGDEAHLGPAGAKRIEAVIRAVQFQARGPTGSDRMQLVLLMDAAALPADQRAELEALLRRPGDAAGDGLEAKLAEGEFGTAFAMLNGMNMAGMLARLTRLGRAWHSYLVANLSAADALGPHSRGRLEIALVAVDRAMAGKATADDLLQLRNRMAAIGLPGDQQQEVLAVVPRARGGDAESIAGYFENVGLSPLLLPLAVARSFRLLDGRTPEQVAATGEKVSEDILRALISHSRAAAVQDAEAIRQGLQRAWTSRFPGTPPPWDVGRPATVADMAAADKLGKAVDAAVKQLGPEFGARIQELKTPESIAMMAGFTTIYVASQLTPAGWVADVLVGGLVVAGLVMGGMEALEIVRHVAAFLSTAVNAGSEADFDAAGHHLAVAVTKLGVDVVLAILLHRVGKGATGVAKRALASPGLPGLKLGLVTPDGMLIPDLPPETLQTRGGGGGGPKKVRAPAGGEILFEGTRADGTTVIRSRVGRSPGRLGTEDLLPSSVEVNVPGWERAHSQGNITGAESARGIRYAPKEVNQKLQRLGIEQAIRDLFSQKAPDVEVIMTTETRAHPGSLRLAEIIYRIDLKKPTGATLRVYEAAIEVQNTTTAPRCTPKPPEPIGWSLLESGGWLKALPRRR
ncbi:polymorphic toxin type 4 domain-containing protein [Amycolatopsis sp. NEAU-NG30]|uniref:Polymorphic toxin type 4 domain-containing protein n=1 Tax=Amycolatopsis melonis TaxID=3156488 RepID=A0ABV0LD71_9PSEU